MRTLILMLILTTLASIVQLGNGYPKATDRAERWQLRLDTGDLRFYRAADTGAGYWILVYEVTNETDKDHRWIPQFDLVTDKGEIIPDGNDVPRSVKLAVLAIFGDPLMQSQSDASGPLLQGEENAIRSVAIWKAGREDIREVQVFAGGVSGDTADIIHPISGEKTRESEISVKTPRSCDSSASVSPPLRIVAESCNLALVKLPWSSDCKPSLKFGGAPTTTDNG